MINIMNNLPREMIGIINTFLYRNEKKQLCLTNKYFYNNNTIRLNKLNSFKYYKDDEFRNLINTIIKSRLILNLRETSIVNVNHLNNIYHLDLSRCYNLHSIKLENIEILDVSECHNLESIQQKNIHKIDKQYTRIN